MIRVVFARLRAWVLRLRGARAGAKCAIGKRLVVRYARGIVLGTRVEIEHDVYLKLVKREARLAIGDYAFIGRGCELDVAESVTIGAHALLAPGVFITDHTHTHAAKKRLDEQGTCSAPVTIGDDAWLGVNCVILAGVTIGTGAVVGAGAVVTKSVDPYAIVAGVPARVIGKRD